MNLAIKIGQNQIFEKNKAIGVEVLRNGKLEKYYANNQIILTAGTYISPKILMHSGIGDEEELKKHSIRTKINL